MDEPEITFASTIPDDITLLGDPAAAEPPLSLSLKWVDEPSSSADAADTLAGKQ